MRKKNEVYPGAVIRIEANGKFEGYVRLIEIAGKEFSEMQTDISPVVVNRRWLVEYIEEDNLTGAERFTQAALRGKRTHRNIQFKAGAFSRVYKRYSYNPPTAGNNDEMIDDFIDECF